MSKNVPFDKVFPLIIKNVTEYTFHPVGDLVNKLSNYSKDNIIHRDEIKYNKNKNLKIQQFLTDPNKLIVHNLKSNETKGNEDHDRKESITITPLNTEKQSEENKFSQESERTVFKSKDFPLKEDKNEVNLLVEKILNSEKIEKESTEKNINLKRWNSLTKKSKKKIRKIDSKSKDKKNIKITNYFKK